MTCPVAEQREEVKGGCESDCDGVSRLALAFILKAGKLKGKKRRGEGKGREEGVGQC